MNECKHIVISPYLSLSYCSLSIYIPHLHHSVCHSLVCQNTRRRHLRIDFGISFIYDIIGWWASILWLALVTLNLLRFLAFSSLPPYNSLRHGKATLFPLWSSHSSSSWNTRSNMMFEFLYCKYTSLTEKVWHRSWSHRALRADYIILNLLLVPAVIGHGVSCVVISLAVWYKV